MANKIQKVNTMRNRIAHHEPVCFYLQDPVISTTHVLGIYSKMQTLFAWMGIDSQDLLYGLVERGLKFGGDAAAFDH